MQLLTYPNCQRANEAERVFADRLPGRFGPGILSPKTLRKLFEDLRLRRREKYLSGLASRVNPRVQVFSLLSRRRLFSICFTGRAVGCNLHGDEGI